MIELLLNLAERFGLPVFLLGAVAWHHLRVLKDHSTELLRLEKLHRDEVKALKAENERSNEKCSALALALAGHKTNDAARYERAQQITVEALQQVTLTLEARDDA